MLINAPDVNFLSAVSERAPCNERVNDRVFRDEAEVLVDVVPHHELAEREKAEEAAVPDLPARASRDLRADGGEDPVDVIAALVRRELPEPLDGHAELGPEVL